MHDAGSPEERAAVRNAVNQGANRGIYAKEGTPDDVVFKVLHPEEHGFIGDNFKVEIEASNNSNDHRTLSLYTKIDSCYYTGNDMAVTIMVIVNASFSCRVYFE